MEVKSSNAEIRTTTHSFADYIMTAMLVRDFSYL